MPVTYQMPDKSFPEGEPLFRTLVENALAGIYLFQDGKMVYVNSRMEEISGRPAEEILRGDVFEFIHPEDREMTRSKVQDRLMGKASPGPYRLRILHPQKGVRWVLVLADRVEYRGQPAILGNMLDITEQLETEQKYRLLVELAGEAIVVAQDGVLKYVNPKAVSMLGYSEEELRSLPFVEFIHPEDRVKVAENHRRRLAGEEAPEVYPFRLIHKDGRTVWVEIRAVRILWEGRPATLNLLTDVTERIGLHEELKRSEHLFRTFFEFAPDACFLTDQEGRFLDGNRATEELIGRPKEQLIGRSFLESGIVPQEAVEEATSVWRELLIRKHIEPKEWELIRGDGTRFLAEVRLVPVELGDREVVLGIARDVTKERKAEDALRESEAMYRLLVENAPVGIISVTDTGEIREVNPKLLEILGSPSAQATRAINILRFPPLVQSGISEHIRSCIESGEDIKRETLYTNKWGKTSHLRYHITPIRDPHGHPVGAQAVVEDITKEKRLEAQFLQAQKMEAVGRLAGGLAHDFNNILTTILGQCELLLSDAGDLEAVQGRAEEIMRAAQRASDLTKQLLAFSRKQLIRPEVLDLNDVIFHLRKMLQRLIGEDVELRTHLNASDGLIMADRSQMEQVLMNLAVNARDAMLNGGTLTIETADVELDADYARAHGVDLTPGPYVMLAVSDTGVGMNEATLSRIFEPFFTTKGVGRGTGLGLSTVYGIVKQSGGYIWAYSEPGRGTTFKIYLPKFLGEEKPPEKSSRRAPPEGGSETILVVEDDASVRKVAKTFLEHFGYTVFEAASAWDALEFCRRDIHGIHLFLADVILPEMSGRELAERIRSLKSDMKVLYMSGYTDDVIVKHGVLDPGVAFIQKPFTMEALARKVREVLDN